MTIDIQTIFKSVDIVLHSVCDYYVIGMIPLACTDKEAETSLQSVLAYTSGGDFKLCCDAINAGRQLLKEGFKERPVQTKFVFGGFSKNSPVSISEQTACCTAHAVLLKGAIHFVLVAHSLSAGCPNFIANGRIDILNKICDHLVKNVFNKDIRKISS